MGNNPRIPFKMSTERRKLNPPEGKPLIVYINIQGRDDVIFTTSDAIADWYSAEDSR